MIPTIVFVLFLSAEADSQPPRGPEGVRKETAASFLKMGVESRRKGDHEEALQKFRLAHEIAPCGQTFVQMGLAEQSLQRWVDSEEHLSRGLEEADDWVRKYRSVIETALATVRGRIAVLEISGPEGAQVAINGQARGTLPMKEVKVNEGAITVAIQARGQPAWSKSLTVNGGSRVVVAVESLPATAPVSQSPVPATVPVASSKPVGHNWHDWLGGFLLGAGLTAVGFGTYALIKDGTCADRGCLSVFASKTLGWVSVGAGAGAVLAGGIILLTAGGTDKAKVAFGVTPGGFFARGQF